MDAGRRGAALIGLWRELTGVRGPPDRLMPGDITRLVPAIRKLSRGLTGTRGLVGGPYLDDPDLLGAYLLHLWPVSHAQAATALRLAGGGRGRALDLGSGPGPGAIALAEAGFGEVVAADWSGPALQLADRLARALGAPLRTRAWRAGEQPLPEGPFDLVYLGHVLNEVGGRRSTLAERLQRRTELLQAITTRLAPGGRILLVEPASHALNAELLGLRDLLLAQGWPVLGPCTRAGPCPALAEKVACHATARWSPPRSWQELARATHIDRAEPGFGWLLLGAPGGGVAHDPSCVRVVSERMINKAGRHRVIVCGEGGRFSLSAAAAGAEAWRRAWSRVDRGDLLSVVRPEPREGGWGLREDTELTVLVSASDPP